ncbi:MAG: prepilin-type N-terminal cleavage/methylation domain-containing protein, partial [Phycisphaeraceae bacterium]|nr:prepilin-type N-terminal cleavage/methylation domain-containing protein [Phycisphaeraceae bacterium]
MMHRATLHRGRGFTLVEAMVVVSLVFMLITIAAPVIADARATAQRTVCL